MLNLLVGPGDERDFRAAVPSKGQERPSQAAIHIHPVAGIVMPSGDPSATAGRKPEGRNAGNLPLTAVAMTAQYEIDGMVVVEHVEDVGRMSQE